MSKFELVLDYGPIGEQSIHVGECRHTERVILLHPLLLSSGQTLESVSEVMRHELAHACLDPGEGHGKRWTYLNERMGGCPEFITDPELTRTFRDLEMRLPPKRQIAESWYGLAVTLEATCSHCNKTFGLSLGVLDMLGQCPNPECKGYFVPALDEESETWHTHRATCPNQICGHIIGLRFRQISTMVECPKCEGRFVPLTEEGTKMSDEHQSSEESFVGDAALCCGFCEAGLQDMCRDTAPAVLVGGVPHGPSCDPQMCIRICPKPQWIRHFVSKPPHLEQFLRKIGDDETIQVPAPEWSEYEVTDKDWSHAGNAEWFYTTHRSALQTNRLTNQVSSAMPLRRVTAIPLEHIHYMSLSDVCKGTYKCRSRHLSVQQWRHARTVAQNAMMDKS